MNEYKCFTPIDSNILPENSKILGSRFVFRTKRDQNGNITKYKGRLVAKGYTQRPGIDFNETFAPVAKFTSIRTLVALSAANGYHIYEADVDKAIFMACWIKNFICESYKVFTCQEKYLN